MKILIADDDPIIRQVLMNLLSKWGYGVVPTTNGAEAWEVLQHDPELRIGLFDWFMPEVNGMELTRRIREANIAPFYVMLVTRAAARTACSKRLKRARMTSSANRSRRKFSKPASRSACAPWSYNRI